MTEAEINNIFFTRIMGYLRINNVNGISIRDLEKVKDNLSKLKVLNISLNELVLKDNWYMYDGEYYYYKKLYSAMKVVNELLGEILSMYMCLPTIHYTLALDYDHIVGVLSKNFRVKGKKYISAIDVPTKRLSVFTESLESKRINELRRTLDRLLIRDFYASASDKLRNVLLSKSYFRGLNLEESFDYEFSFLDKREYLTLQFEKMMEFNIGKALKEIEETHGIIINDELKNYYKHYDSVRKQELRAALKK